MKYRIFSLIATLSIFAFSIGIQPTCWGSAFQPELPDELK